jgi:hypothetical protein
MRLYLGTRLGKKFYIGASQSVSGNKKEISTGETFAHSFLKSFLISLAAIFTLFSLVKPKRRNRW